MTTLLYILASVTVTAWLLMIVCSYLEMLHQQRRFDAWAKRDAELVKRFMAACDRDDIAEMIRCNYQLSKNLEGYKEAEHG